MKIVRVLLILLVLVCPSGSLAATPFWATTFDAGRTDGGGVQPAPATNGHFSAGVSSWPPVYRKNATVVNNTVYYHPSYTPSFPGTGNRAYLELNSLSAGGDRYGRIQLSGSPSQVSVGGNILPVVAPYGTCLGGTRDGQHCTEGGDASWQKCPGGWCRTPRAPLLSVIDSGGKRGCAVYVSQTCSSAGVTLQGECPDPIVEFSTLYGSPQDKFKGRCGASKTMTDTVCGGVCSSASDCIQGRPLESGDTVTQCVNDSTLVTCSGKVCVGGSNNTVSCTTDSQCPGGVCGGCHCINECDEQNSNEATCEERTFASLFRPPRQNYAILVEQENQTGAVICRTYGGVLTKLCEGGSVPGKACSVDGEVNVECTGGGTCRANRMQVFARGIQTAQKIGVCTGGTELTDGGQNRTACSTNTDCNCDTTWPTYNAGTCTNGTCTTTGSTPETPVTVPDKIVLGWDDGQSHVARIDLDDVKIETGATPTTTWRTETTLPNAEGGTLTQEWTSSGNSCTNDGCLTGNGDASIEPDDPFTVGTVTRLQHTTSGAATHEWTWGNLATTSDTPFAVTMSVAAQDAESAASTAASVQVGLRKSTGSTALGDAFDLANFESTLVCDGGTNNGGACVVDSDCPGASNACKASDGQSTPARAFPTRPLTLAKDPSDGTSALTTTIINGLIGRIVKGTPHGLSNEPRVTFGTLETFLSTVTPVAPAVLPGNKVVSFIGDSLTNDPIFFATLTGLVVEPSKIYDQSTGGMSLGNGYSEFATLLAGNSGNPMSTVSVIGALGTPPAVSFVNLTANTLDGFAMVDPAYPTSIGGLGKHGWCEDWTSGGGYGSKQGKECTCPQSSSWSPSSIYAAGACIIKNANFGSSATCTCTRGSTTECELGGTAPGSPGTKTSVTCPTTGVCYFSPQQSCTSNGQCASNVCLGVCPNNKTGVTITSAAGTVAWAPPGCNNSPDCPGVCVATPTLGKILETKRAMEVMAAANGTKLVWVTMHMPPKIPWWWSIPAYQSANAQILEEQEATGGSWVDLGRYMLDVCGEEMMSRDHASECIKSDGIHYTPYGLQLYAGLVNACISNTTLAGVTGKTTDGTCTTAAGGTCSSGKCSSGLRKNNTCTTDADCNYCSAGAVGKLGKKCTADRHCGYYYCPFS